MARGGTVFQVDTSPTKDVVVKSLTKDASVEACIYDLIDNAVDAARNTILSGLPAKSQGTLPDSYAGFEVKVSLSSTGFRIEDNCGGIPVQPLRTMVMRFGKQSKHPLGIGIYGVGLNRALFKLGRVTHLKTDTGSQRAELVLKVADYLTADTWELPAEEFASTGEIGTTIEIRQLPSEIAQSFADKEWIAKLRNEIGHRYGRYIDKKLTLLVNEEAIENLEPQIREGGPFDGQYKFYKTEDGIAIHIEYGQHVDHRFTSEPDYNKVRNKDIPEETGWTVVCNDRAVLVSDRTYRTGWDSKFHTEFYGFVGSVSFVGDPAKLPWDTTKTEVDLHNPAYQLALRDMRRFVEGWRKFAELRKKGAAKGEKLHPLPPKPPAPKPTEAARKKPATKTQKPIQPIKKPDHNQFRTVLPADINELHCFDKLLALVHHGKAIDIVDLPYAGLALIRMLFETSVVTHMDRHKKFDELKQFAINNRKKKITLTPDAEKNLTPSLGEMLAYFDGNPGFWGTSKANYLKHSVKKMGAHQKTINGVLHNPWQQASKTEAVVIRDEVLPLLRHLIET